MSREQASSPDPNARQPLLREVWRAWVVDPLVFGLVAFPLTLAGRVRRVANIRSRRLDTSATPPGSGRDRAGGAALTVLVTFVPTLLAFVAALLVLYLVYAGELYVLRPDMITQLGYMFEAMPDSEGTWGGPTLIGAWFIHAMSALGMQVVSLALIRAVGWLCGRASRNLIGV